MTNKPNKPKRQPSDAEWKRAMSVVCPPGTYVYEWEVEVDLDGLGPDSQVMPKEAEWVELKMDGKASVRFRFGITSPQPVDEDRGRKMAFGRAFAHCEVWSPNAQEITYRSFLNRSCRT
jgi:hypothetical protein